MLYLGQELILPLIYAAFITILLNPVVNFLMQRKFNRILAVSTVLTIATLILATIVLFISWKISTLDAGLADLMARFETVLNQFVHWIAKTFRIREWKVNLWMTDSRKDLMNGSNSAIGVTLVAMSGLLATLFLTPVYVFFMLLYKPHLVQFIHRLFAKTNINHLNHVVADINDIIKKYLSGLFIQFSIVSLLDCAGLLLLGIEYPLVLGIIGGLLNLIPYLGGLVTMLLFAGIALVTKPPIFLLYVILLYGAIQFIDNNIIVPKILGSRVKLNALISVFAVITGGMLWGIPGMFLSIPLVAILKLIFDLYEPLTPLGFLMGEPESQELESPNSSNQ